MASKLGTILSLFFIFLAFLFGVDLVMIQLNYSSLDSLTPLINYNISKNGGITESLKEYVYSNVQANLYCSDYNVEHIYENGASYEYYLEKKYIPLILKDEVTIRIKRFAVIKIYN